MSTYLCELWPAIERYQVKLDQAHVSEQAVLWVDKSPRCVIRQTKINSSVYLREFGAKVSPCSCSEELGSARGCSRADGESKVESLEQVSPPTEAVRISQRGF